MKLHEFQQLLERLYELLGDLEKNSLYSAVGRHADRIKRERLQTYQTVNNAKSLAQDISKLLLGASEVPPELIQLVTQLAELESEVVEV